LRHRTRANPFDVRQPQIALRIGLDPRGFDAIANADLIGFLSHKSVEPVIFDDSSTPGHVTFQASDGDQSILGLRWHHENGWTDTGIFSWFDWQSMAGAEAGRRQWPLGELLPVARVAGAAVALECDFVITESPALIEWKVGPVAELSRLRPAEALAILGLFLRNRGDYTIRQVSGGSHSYNRGLFYWVATRELLPAGWRWFSSCVNSWHHTNDDAIVNLAQSALQRIDRALRARDAIHVQMQLEHNNDTADEAMAQLDAALVFLVGALDAVARVAHIAVGLPRSSLTSAGWTRDKWLRRLGQASAALEQAASPSTQSGATMRILHGLRNSIHGQALQSIAFQEGIASRRENLIKLPHGEFVQVISGMESLGGRERWGLRDLLPDAAGVEPDTLIDTLFGEVIDATNTLMTATPVELLSGATSGPLSTHPPAEDVFGEVPRKAIRALLGF